MPVAKIDPVETFYSVGSSLVGRIFLFFSAGWVGLFLGAVAASFGEWQELLNPVGMLNDVIHFIVDEFWLFLVWPLIALFWAAFENVGLFFFLLLFFAVAFLVMVFTEQSALLWWLIVVAVVSTLPLFMGDAFSWPGFTVLAFFWMGFGSLGWWLLRKYHPEVVEVVGNVMQGNPEEKLPPAPRRKAPPGSWPDGVEGFDEDDEEP